MLHKHHIIPKYMGGSDDPSNLVMLTVEEHAEEHKKLYELYGNKEDYLAYNGLLGLMKKEDIVKELLSMAGKKAGHRNVESGHLQNISSLGGRAVYEKHKEKIDETLKLNAQRAKGKKGKEWGGAKRKWMWINDGSVNKKVLADSVIPEGFNKGRLMGHIN